MTAHERIYRRLLRAYPRGFRDEYGELMAQLFADQVRDARAGGVRALFGLWLCSLSDISTNVIAHRFRKGRNVSNSKSLYPAIAVLLGATLLTLLFTRPAVALLVFALGVTALAAWQRRHGLLRPDIPRPRFAVGLGVVLIALPTALISSPLIDEEGWGTLLYGTVWMVWALSAVAGLAFVVFGLFQLAANAARSRAESSGA